MSFNGHKNWNHWNVSLWISNDESLYRLARVYLRRHSSKDAAARALLEDLNDDRITHTPDGARYTVTTVRAALAGLE